MLCMCSIGRRPRHCGGLEELRAKRSAADGQLYKPLDPGVPRARRVIVLHVKLLFGELVVVVICYGSCIGVVVEPVARCVVCHVTWRVECLS